MGQHPLELVNQRLERARRTDKNPYALDRNPCGSSSGSAVAASANLCVAAIGTETDGSVVSPSSANGIVGIKPTVGLVSRSGVIPISHSQDTPGPMCRCVRDAAILLGGLPEWTRRMPSLAIPSVRHSRTIPKRSITADSKGARIGVARNYFGFDDSVDLVMKGALDALKHEGATLVDPAEIPNIDKVGDAEQTVLLFELKAGLAAYFSRLGPKAPVRTLKDVIEFNERHRSREMPFFGQDLFIKAEAKGSLESYEYQEALAKCRRMARTEGIDAVMDKFKLDALVAPTVGPACLTDLVTGDHWRGESSTAAAVAGYPSITVPAGLSSDFLWDCCFSAGPGASRRCSSWRMHLNRRPKSASPRDFWRRPNCMLSEEFFDCPRLGHDLQERRLEPLHFLGSADGDADVVGPTRPRSADKDLFLAHRPDHIFAWLPDVDHEMVRHGGRV